MSCTHDNFDEFFEVCPDCKATRESVLADEFKNELQGVYGKMLRALGIESGDIDPQQAMRMDALEDALAKEVGSWLTNRYESEE